MGNIVEVDRVTKVYRKGPIEIRPLDGVSVNVEEGEFLSLMGPSGSGKTTLLNLIAGIDTPTSGHVVVAGEDLGSLSDAELSRWRTHNVGYIFQIYNLVPVLTARENVELPLLLFKMSRAKRKQQVETAMKAAGILDRADRSSASPSLAPSSPTLGSSWRTSRPATSTRTPSSRSWPCSRP